MTAAETAGPDSVVFYSTGGVYDVLPAAATGILGQYVATGVNHGRRTFQRRNGHLGSKAALKEVVLFYWDDRNGASNAGWWLGSRVGGGQVYGRCESAAIAPPCSGWRLPVDGLAQKCIVCQAQELPEENELEDDAEDIVVSHKRGGLADIGATAQPPAKKPKSQQVLVLASMLQGSDAGETEQLLGEYVQHSGNHGKRTYLKKGSGAPGFPPIWLYFWDSRDGAEAAGWWFGRSVGGNQVFAHAPAQASATPPRDGWRLAGQNPMDRPDLSLGPPSHVEEKVMSGPERIVVAKTVMEGATAEATKAVSLARSVLDAGELFEEGVQATISLLQDRIRELDAAAASLHRHQRAARHQGAKENVLGELRRLHDCVLAFKSQADEQLQRASDAMGRFERDAAAEEDATVLERLLPGVSDLVADAELAAEIRGPSARAALEAAVTKVAECKTRAREFGPAVYKVAAQELEALSTRCQAIKDADGEDDDPDFTMMAMEVDVLGDDILDDDDETQVVEAPAMAVQTLFSHSSSGESATATRLLLSAVTRAETQRVNETGDRDSRVPPKLLRALESAETLATQPVGGMEQMAAHAHREALRRKAAEVTGARGAVAKASKVSAQRARVLQPVALRLEAVAQQIATGVRALDRMIAAADDDGADERTVEGALEAVAAASDAVDKLALSMNEARWWRHRVELADAQRSKRMVDYAQASATAAEMVTSDARGRLEAQVRMTLQEPQPEQRAMMRRLDAGRMQLSEVQLKLVPLRSIGRPFYVQLQAKDALDAIAKRIAEALRKNPQDSASELEEVQSLLESYSKQRLAPTAGSFPGGALRDALMELRDELLGRCRAATDRLEQRGAERQKKREENRGDVLLKQAKKIVRDVELWTIKMDATREGLSSGAAATVADAAEQATATAAGAEAAADTAQTRLLEILVQARFLPDALGVVEGLEVLRNRADEVAAKAGQLREFVATQTAEAEMPDVSHTVRTLEDSVREVAAASESLDVDNLGGAVAPASAEEVSRRVLALVRTAASAGADARLAISVRKSDSRNSDESAFRGMLDNLAARQAAASAELARLKQAAAMAPRSWKVLQEQLASLAKLEEQVEQAELLNVPVGDEQDPTEEEEDRRVNAVLAVSKAVEEWKAAAQELATCPHGALRLAMKRLSKRCEEGAVRQLQQVEAMGRNWRERALCRAFHREAEAALATVQTACGKLEAVDSQFLKGIEVGHVDKAEILRNLKAHEAAAAAAETAANAAKGLVSSRRKELLAFRCLAAQARSEASRRFAAHDVAISSAARRVAASRREADGRRRALARSSQFTGSQANKSSVKEELTIDDDVLRQGLVVN